MFSGANKKPERTRPFVLVRALLPVLFFELFFFCQFRVLRPHYLPLEIIINRYRSGIQQTTEKKVAQNFEVKFARKKEIKDGSSENFIFESDLNIRRILFF